MIRVSFNSFRNTLFRKNIAGKWGKKDSAMAKIRFEGVFYLGLRMN